MLMGTSPAKDGDHLPGHERSWGDFWTEQRGWKRDLSLVDGAHGSYTDLQAVAPQLASVTLPEQLADAVGTVDPARSVRAQRDYLGAFFDLHLGNRDRGVLDRPSPHYPEIEFVY